MNGDLTLNGSPFFADQLPAPVCSYGISKMEAEQVLKSISSQSDMEYVIIRPPLVYGPGVKANFLSLIKLIKSGIPLPFGLLTENRRSFVGIDNLTSLINLCLDCPAAANQTFLVSDDEDLSTQDLVLRIANALGVKPSLFAFPPSFFHLSSKVLGKRDVYRSLCRSLQVDISKTCRSLDWSPPFRLHDNLEKALAFYRLRS